MLILRYIQLQIMHYINNIVCLQEQEQLIENTNHMIKYDPWYY